MASAWPLLRAPSLDGFVVASSSRVTSGFCVAFAKGSEPVYTFLDGSVVVSGSRVTSGFCVALAKGPQPVHLILAKPAVPMNAVVVVLGFWMPFLLSSSS